MKREVKSWRDRASSHLGQARVADVPAAQCAAPSDGPVSPAQVAHVSPAPAVVGDGHAVHMRGDLDGGDAEGGGSVGNHLGLRRQHKGMRRQAVTVRRRLQKKHIVDYNSNAAPNMLN